MQIFVSYISQKSENLTPIRGQFIGFCNRFVAGARLISKQIFPLVPLRHNRPRTPDLHDIGWMDVGRNCARFHEANGVAAIAGEDR